MAGIKSLKKGKKEQQQHVGRGYSFLLLFPFFIDGRTDRTDDGRMGLDALDGNGALAVELVCVAGMAFLLAVLEALALVVLKHAVLAAVVAAAEAAVADNGLGTVLAVLEGAADLLGRHAAAQRQGQVQGCVWADGVVGEGCFRRRKVLAGVDDAQIRGRVHVGAQGEERAKGAYRGI